MSRPGFRITKLESDDDETIELLLEPDGDDQVADLVPLLDELRDELRTVRDAKEKLFEETVRLRDELTETRVELANVRFAAAFPKTGRNLKGLHNE